MKTLNRWQATYQLEASAQTYWHQECFLNFLSVPNITPLPLHRPEYPYYCFIKNYFNLLRFLTNPFDTLNSAVLMLLWNILYLFMLSFNTILAEYPSWAWCHKHNPCSQGGWWTGHYQTVWQWPRHTQAEQRKPNSSWRLSSGKVFWRRRYYPRVLKIEVNQKVYEDFKCVALWVNGYDPRYSISKSLKWWQGALS